MRTPDSAVTREVIPALYDLACRYSLAPVLLLLACLLICTDHVVADTGQAAEQAARLKQLRTRIDEVKEELGSIRDRQSRLHKQLEHAEKEIGVVSAERRRLKSEAQASEEKRKSLGRKRQQQQDVLQQMRSTLARDMRSAYAMGRQAKVKLLLNQQDPAIIGRMMTYHSYLSRARSERMQSIRTVLDKLASIEQALHDEKARLEELHEQQREKSQLLEQQQANRHKLLANFKVDLKKKTSELSTLKQDEQRLQSLVQSLQQALRDIPPAAGQYQSLRALKGRLAWPVAGRISMRFGERHAEGKLKSRGLLIRARADTDVYAISKGRVAFADWLRGFGLLLILDHGDGYMSLYGHNRSLFKEVGEWVEAGEVVTAVGNSGGQAQSALYLELRKDGRPFNPAPWFAGMPPEHRASR
ncbi:MAG: peptidoglycan DD-metalloendopeptidase family protein [Halobacteria archaeon]|nr:peptidoglycan DD-metalloendopeptidase family protein [Halobacteria archaeon]